MRYGTGYTEAAPSRQRPEAPLWWCAAGFFCLIGLATLLDIDVWLSSVFYDPQSSPRWFLSEAPPWRWLYYGEYPVMILAIGAAVVWVGSWRYRPWVRYRRTCALFVLAVMLGPGMLVNGVVKPVWGRPRPKQTEIFGSSRPYHPWWRPGEMGGGKSLPSGHASMGYALVAVVYWVAPSRTSRRQRRVLVVALGYGSLLGMTRIIQGGHFATDVLWSGCLMCCLVALLYRLLPVQQPWPPPPPQEASLASV